MVLLASVLTLLAAQPWGADRAVHKLALLAAMDHAARPALAIHTDDLGALAAALGSNAPFEISIVHPEPGAVLAGGRVCRFGDCPLVYTCWRVGAADVALYQVRRGEFGLRAGLPERDVEVPDQGSPVSRCRIRVWTDADFAYVVVHDDRGPDGA